MVLVVGDKTSICITAAEIPELNRMAIGNAVIKNGGVRSVSKV
jgi:hypothetical protein